ncbi:MAG: DUF5667 domain-containing protein [Marmoricola sp.]
MTPLFPAQRAAEEFDRVLRGTATPAATDRYADLLDTVGMLRTRPEVLPRADFVGDLRSRLMTAARTELVVAPSVIRDRPPTRQRTNRRLGTVAASLVILGGTAGMAAAASSSLPGEGLYPIKRGVEQAETAVRLGDVGKGKGLLDQAATRLDEVRSLQAQGSPDAELISTTIDSFRGSADSGSAKLFTAYQASGDTEDITTVRTFTAKQMAGIAALSGTSATTDASLVDAADTLADIDQQARLLCGSCGPAATVATPAALSAGAGAATAHNLLARPVSQAAIDIRDTRAARVAVQLAALKAAAEESAGKIPKIDPSDVGSGSGVPSVSGDKPVTSTITADGKLVPSLSSGVAVKDLVSGVTGSVDSVTTKITQGQKTPLETTVKGLTDSVDKTTDDLLP